MPPQTRNTNEKTHMARSLNPGSRTLRAVLVALVALSALDALVACSSEHTEKLPTPDTALGASSASRPSPSSGSGDASESLNGTPPIYVGTRHDPLPRGVSYEGGAVLLGPNGKPTAFALDHVLTPHGNYLWLDSIRAGDGEHTMHARTVRAELALPPARSGETLLIGTCDVKGVFDAAVVAFAQSENHTKRLTHIRAAWRANPATGMFDVLAPQDVVCEDPGA